MNIQQTNGIKRGLLSLSALLLLAACVDGQSDESINTEDTAGQNDDMSDETVGEDLSANTVEDDVANETEEEPVDGQNRESQTDSPGIEGMTFSVDLDEAIALFFETFGSEDINISEIQFTRDDGRYLYEFEGWDGQYAYELDIDAETGAIVKQEQDDDDDTDDTLELDGIVTPEAAMEAALEAAGSGYVEDWELEVEGGRTVFEIDIEGGADQRIDAQTGEVM
ncbi:putative lipoprotein [Alkalibacterium sp. AK22]|uniref:PepSY domain-containing protein n=1 Tax=Alkalibacterium sp. AK22 TaxID=1229520 RepID=UPI0004453C5B|nr:PepSY domain-containing protein [Alkalibacterium sp. AK22]EXJ23147.1 putative lipoprotein [Alkalibacterium sp. AK22]